AIRRRSSVVRLSISRTNAWLIEESDAKSNVTQRSAARRSGRSGMRPAANVTAVRLVTANSTAALSPYRVRHSLRHSLRRIAQTDAAELEARGCKHDLLCVVGGEQDEPARGLARHHGADRLAAGVVQMTAGFIEHEER